MKRERGIYVLSSAVREILPERVISGEVTVYSFARLAGVDEGTIRKVVSGKRKFTRLSSAEKIAMAVGDPRAASEMDWLYSNGVHASECKHEPCWSLSDD